VSRELSLEVSQEVSTIQDRDSPDGTVDAVDGIDVVRRPPFGDNPLVGERGASTQRRILDAALVVFGEHGFHDTRVELITEAAGCSRPAFYQYFSSKDDVFWRLAGHMAKEMDRLALELGDVGPDESGVAHLTDWFDGVIDLCTSYAPLLDAFQAATRGPAPAASGARDVGQRLGEALLHNVSGDVNDIEIASSAGIIISILMRTVHYWRIGLGGLDRARFVEGLARTTHRLLHGARKGVNTHDAIAPPPARAPQLPDPPVATTTDRPLRPRGQHTRKKLLDAGSTVLPLLGYHDTRVDDIVDEAGVSHGSFYRYFDSKGDLFHTLAAEASTRMVDLLSVFPEATDDDSLSAWLRTWFSSYRDNGGIISVWQEIEHHDPELVRFSLEIALVAFDRLVRIVHRRGFGDSVVDAIVLLSVIERAPYSVLVLGYSTESHAVEACALLIRRGLFGDGQ
jgi:AcrR family transcriptional regulator